MNTDAPVDLRSDTLTHPTERMRQAMHAAEVGDDTFGDDPTVKRLEAMAAERLGKEAALYVPSGSMGNSTALITYLEIGARSGGSRPALAVHETHAHMFSSDRDRFARALFEVRIGRGRHRVGACSPPSTCSRRSPPTPGPSRCCSVSRTRTTTPAAAR